LPPVGALDEPRGEEGIFERARSNPRLLIAIAAGTILILAWIGWAIHVTSSNGATAGLGVVIAWPAMLAALALISLPFVGGYLLIKRLSPSDGEETTAVAEADIPDEDAEDEGSDDEPEDPAEEEDEEVTESEGDEELAEDEDSEEVEESDDEDEEESEAKASSK
jgi:hypothetical protein